MIGDPIKPERWNVQRPPSAVDTRQTNDDGFRQLYREGPDWAGDINLREEIAGILRLRGRYVFLRRTQYRRCGCWNEATRESNQDCPYCTGTGWQYKDELHLARLAPVTRPAVAAELEDQTPVGLIGVGDYIFWFGHDVEPGPSKRDLIIEVTTDEATRLPVKAYNIEKVWNIGQVHAFRDRNGRIEYWACWVKEGATGKE